MIQRVVLIKLKPEYQSETERKQIAAHTEEVLTRVDDVRTLSVAVPADARARRDWDLCIVVRLDDLEAVERYRTERTHRAYVDVYLEPMLQKIRVWNFELS